MKPYFHWTNQPRDVREQALKGIAKGWGRKPRTGKTLICPTCGKEFYIKPSYLKRAKEHYCSKKCFDISKKGKIPPNFEEIRNTFQKGKENINWRGGITPYPEEWTGSLRHRVWVRDNNECQRCGKKGKKRSDLVCHHIDFDKKNCSFENLQLLCRKCHALVHWEANKGVPGLKKYNLGL